MKGIGLGPFELEHAVGRGGMAVVWRGRHVEQDVPVAIKIMTERLARHRRHRDRFLEEVRSVARLNHPGIVMVLDVGEIGPKAASRLFLPVGCPYLAMEFVESGTLTNAELPRDWETTYSLATQVLDALAHAHARGVIHRDLKGDNILIDGSFDGSWRAKLSDFGLARYVHDMSARDADTVSGTPHYMAPEQILGESRSQGPWTDLYSVGCLVWWLLCGVPPFPDGEKMEVLKAHLLDELPPFEPRFDVPAGFGAWLDRMLRKEPVERFRRAADAAFALHELAREPSAVVPGVGGDGPVAAPPGALGVTAPATPPGIDYLTLGEFALTGDIHYERRGGGDRPSSVPPVPVSWHRMEAPATPPRLLGAGLGLFGLRTVPLVDRVSERDVLWDELRIVAETSSPRIVTVSGPGGVGKSRLVEWVAERAHEVGAATVMSATHVRGGGLGHGLGPMLSRFFRSEGLAFDEVLERVSDELRSFDPIASPRDATTLARIIAPGAAGDAPTPAERDRAICEMLATISAERPVLMIVDDAQWATAAAHLVGTIAERGDLPVLVLLTLRRGPASMAVDRSGGPVHTLERLEENGHARRLDVAPLSSSAHVELIDQLLGFDEELTAEVAARTSGTPLFAVQLVGDWVDRGILNVGEAGFVLQEGAAITVPDDVLSVCLSRVLGAIEHVDGGDSERLFEAVQLAACLGRRVDRREWLATLRQTELAGPGQLENVLATAGLVRSSDEGFEFLHEFVADSLLEVAIRAGEEVGLHATCADVLDEFGTRTPGPELSRRIALHREAAGDLAAACERLLDAAEQLATTAEYSAAFQVVERRDALLDSLGAPDDDRRRAESTFLRAWIASETGDVEGAEALRDGVETSARDYGWDNLLGRSLRMRCVHELMTGRADTASTYAAEAYEAFERSGNHLGMGQALHDLGFAVRGQGDVDGARRQFEAALEHLEIADDSEYVARVLTALGDCAFLRGEDEVADSYLQQARRVVLATENRQRQAMVALPLGDLARARGQHESARSYFEEALQLWRSIGAPNQDIAELKLIWLRFDEGDFDAAADLERLVQMFEERGRTYAIRYARLGLTVCAAVDGDGEKYDREFELAAASIAESGDVNLDIAELAELASELATRAGWAERAEAALALASRQRGRLRGA